VEVSTFECHAKTTGISYKIAVPALSPGRRSDRMKPKQPAGSVTLGNMRELARIVRTLAG
jgi:hypothetical protein